MHRVRSPEFMDDPAVDADELARSLAFIRTINRRLGGTKSLLRHLERWSHHWPSGRTINLLDVGTGSADLPLAASAWAKQRGFELQITAIDNHATTLACAREHIGSAANIELVQCDAMKLVDEFGPASFDYVHAGMFLHHLSDLQVLTMLRIMERLTRHGLIWNDLVRSRWSLMAIRVLTRKQSEMIKHDAAVSVMAGFSPREVKDIARRLTLDWCSLSVNRLFGRFTLAGEKPGAEW